MLEDFPPELHAYRKRSRQEDMPTFPEDYGIPKLHNVNYVFPYKPHQIYPSDQEILKKLRNNEVLEVPPTYRVPSLDAAAQAVEYVRWICDVDFKDLINDGFAAEDGWLATEALHKAGFNTEDRSHRDINFEIHSG
jgi:hypothetical protein